MLLSVMAWMAYVGIILTCTVQIVFNTTVTITAKKCEKFQMSAEPTILKIC